jgi:ring-1,2-phenylacetyl-CoA epoxidase subunit PaaD
MKPMPNDAVGAAIRDIQARRLAGFTPPTLRSEGPTLVQLQSNGFRCPYCGSRDTALENIFGPTPCRSLRYCRDCKQPFEQFKTI